VLVVDDEEPVLRLLTRLLHDLGHQVVAVTSGAAALEAAATQQFDLLLTDVKMPEMDGFALVEALRQRDAALAEQVIYITGDTLSALTREQMERGEAIFLVKPFAIAQLEETLQRLLRRRSIGLS
jgi:CheY-like chemotaxis protein